MFPLIHLPFLLALFSCCTSGCTLLVLGSLFVVGPSVELIATQYHQHNKASVCPELSVTGNGKVWLLAQFH